jgi:hypothetical protein
MTALTATSTPALAQPSPAATHRRNRRRPLAALQVHPAVQGVSQLAPQAPAQVLPLTVGARVRVSNGLLGPVLGAVLGTFLLGPIGTVVGGVAGWMLTH